MTLWAWADSAEGREITATEQIGKFVWKFTVNDNEVNFIFKNKSGWNGSKLLDNARLAPGKDNMVYDSGSTNLTGTPFDERYFVRVIGHLASDSWTDSGARLYPADGALTVNVPLGLREEPRFRFYSELYHCAIIPAVSGTEASRTAANPSQLSTGSEDKDNYWKLDPAEAGYTFTLTMQPDLSSFTLTKREDVDRIPDPACLAPENLYIRHNFTDNKWLEKTSPAGMEKSADGKTFTYTYTVDAGTSCEFHFIEHPGESWGKVGYAYYPAATGQVILPDTPETIANVKHVSDDPYKGWKFLPSKKGTLTLTVAFTGGRTMPTLELHFEADEHQVYDDWYLFGDTMGWESATPDYKFTTTDGITYTLGPVSLENDKSYKLRNVTAGEFWTVERDRKNSTRLKNGTFPLTNSLDYYGMKGDLTSDYSQVWLTLTESGNAKTLEISGIVIPEAYRVYLRGEGEGLSWTGEDNQLTTNDGVTFTIKRNFKAGDLFRVQDGDTWRFNEYEGVSTGTASDGSACMRFDRDTENVKVSYNKHTGIVSVAFAGNIPDHLYLVSNYYAGFLCKEGKEFVKSETDGRIFSCVVPGYVGDDLNFQMTYGTADDYKDVTAIYSPAEGTVTLSGSGKSPASTFTERDANKLFNIKTGIDKPVKIYADFSGSTPQVWFEIIEKSDLDYYFIGDANDWYSRLNEKGGVIGHLEPGSANALEKTWKFVKTDEKPVGSDADGWYRFDMPTAEAMLWGQFKVFTGHWSGCDYDWAYANNTANYFSTCRMESGQIYDVEKGLSNRDSWNFPLLHNAYKNTTVWFNPETDQVYIQGDPQDYFIYYMRAADADAASVKVKLSNASPNKINYKRDFEDWYNGVELVKIDKGDEFQTEKEDVYGNEITHILNGNLQNGAKVNYTVWKKQIPQGAENPAGAPFVLSVSDCKDASAKDMNVTCRLGNIYIIEDFYVHFRPDAEVLGTDVNAAYRVYGLDENYDLVIYNPDMTKTKVSPTDKTTGWIDLPHRIDGDLLPTGSQVVEWGWDNGEWMVNLEDEADMIRKAVPFQHAGQYLQLKIQVNDAPGNKVQARKDVIANDTYLMPTRLTFGEHPQERALTGTDVYINAGIETGVGEIETEPVEGEYGEATDAAPVYYNLQGVRVAEPRDGIYIRVTGIRTEKVIF